MYVHTEILGDFYLRTKGHSELLACYGLARPLPEDALQPDQRTRRKK
jgi:hypothetical protein